jgi:hypothetical protein
VAAGALLTALCPSLWPVLAAQILIGSTSSVLIPAICAISLGVVGHAAFDARQGRNQTFNSAGNVIAAFAMGLLGYSVSNRSVFFFVVAQSGGGQDELPVSSSGCLGLGNPQGSEAFVAGWSAFVHCQQALVASDQQFRGVR